MSGAGSHTAGGRWNTLGHYVAYASGSLTLAMLELLVHVDDAAAFRALPHVYHAITFPRDAVAVLEAGDLPPEWNAQPVACASQVVGDEWIEGRLTPVLAVPSVIVPLQYRYEPAYMNYLINPGHPEFEQAIETGEVRGLDLDPRLLE